MYQIVITFSEETRFNIEEAPKKFSRSSNFIQIPDADAPLWVLSTLHFVIRQCTLNDLFGSCSPSIFQNQFSRVQLILDKEKQSSQTPGHDQRC